MQSTVVTREPIWDACIALLVFNSLVAVSCLLIGPKAWTRMLCAGTGHLTTIVVVAGLGCGASGLLDDLRRQMDVTPYVLLFLAGLAQLVILRVISRFRLRDPSPVWWPR